MNASRRPDGLDARVTAALCAPVAKPVETFAGLLAHETGCRAVLFYGSNLRTGLLEGVLDFYVLMPGRDKSGIWPRVSYHEREVDGQILRAKVATMSLATFHKAASGQLLDTTIWARFVQPSALVWQADDAAREDVRLAVAEAAMTAARLAVALGPDEATAPEYWSGLFRQTYRAEFRVEKPGREAAILAANPDHFEGLLPVALEAAGIGFVEMGARLRPSLPALERARTLHWWSRRRRMGKTYNLVRLLKASITFEGAGRYAAWKVERHTGVAVKMTPWRERHPVLAAPAVLWQVWRARRRPA